MNNILSVERKCEHVRLMNRALESRSKGMRFDSHCLSFLEVSRVNFPCHTASAYPAVMGTWWTKIVSEWLKLPAYLCSTMLSFALVMCPVRLLGKVMVS